MSNQKYYTNQSGITVPIPETQACIRHLRDNECLYDYADTRSTAADYGNGLKQLLSGAAGPTGQSLQSGDMVLVIGGTFQVEECVCPVNNVQLIFVDNILEGTAGTYNQILDLDGTDIYCEGARTLDRRSTITGGEGAGIIMRGSRCITVNCSGSGHKGLSSTQGYGLWIASPQDAKIINYRASDCQYTGIRGLNCDRLTIEGGFIQGCGFGTGGSVPARAVQFDGSSSLDWVKIDGLTTLANQADTGALINFGQTGSIRKLMLNNVSITNKDQVGPGVSYDSTSREQCFKTDRIEQLEITNCDMRIGLNQGTGYSTSIAFDDSLGVPDSVYVENCSFSCGVAMPSDRIARKAEFVNCSFGLDHAQQYLFWRLPNAPYARIDGCYFLMDSNHGRDFLRTGDASTVLPTDELVIVNNTFEAPNDGRDYNLSDDRTPLPNLQVNPRRLKAHNNKLIITGGGTLSTIRYSNWEGIGNTELNLMWQSPNGEMQFDDSLIGTGPTQGMPDPGTGADGKYFSADLIGYQGQIIRNIAWTDELTNARREQGWVYTNGEWREWTTTITPWAELYMSTSLNTQFGVGTTPSPVDVFDAKNEDRCTANEAAASVTMTLPGRYAFYFTLNFDSTVSKQNIIVTFELDGVVLDIPFTGATRDAGFPILLSTYAPFNMTQAYLDANGGSATLQMLISVASGSADITYWNASFGIIRTH